MELINSDVFVALSDWFVEYASSVFWSLVILGLYLIITKLALPLVNSKVDSSKLKSEAYNTAQHAIRLIVGLVALAILLLIWGINFSGLLLVSTSLITLTGVALFASWSLLSNITAYFIILFHQSLQRGNFIRIIDGDNYIEGYVADVSLFNTKLITEDREVVLYPNNLVMTRPSIINPRVKWKTVGKTTGNDVNPPIDPS